MHVVTIKSLLDSNIACASSSSSRFVVSQSNDLQNDTSSRHCCSFRDSGGGKRSREAEPATDGKLFKKKRKERASCSQSSQAIEVLPECWTIVGRLQLCNRSEHFWKGLYIPSDCVALTDSTATICCCVRQGPDPGFIGRMVRVNSWSFIPAKGTTPTSMSRTTASGNVVRGAACSAENDVSNGSRAGALSKVSGGGASVFRSENSNLNCEPGVLEIHSLALVEGQVPEKMPRLLPPLYVNVAAAPSDRHGIVNENAPRSGREDMRAEGMTVRGLICCISPAFLFPTLSKPTSCPSDVAARGESSRLADGEECNNESISQGPMLGFFLEFGYCPSCSHTSSRGSWKQTAANFTGRTKNNSSVCEDFSSRLEDPAWTGWKTNISDPAPARDCLHVYFSGVVGAWRPVLSCVLGRCVTVTALKRKIVLVGATKESYNIFLATRNSSVVLDCDSGGERIKTSCSKTARSESEQLATHFINNPAIPIRGNVVVSPEVDVGNRKRKGSKTAVGGLTSHEIPRQVYHTDAGVCMKGGTGTGTGTGYASDSGDGGLISFVGVVSDILFQGTLVELDERIWLLLTHQRHAKLQGLRIGAMLSVRDAHALAVKDVIGKTVVLGACMRSHVSVVHFSPLTSPPLLQVQSRSLLLKLIQRLPFTSSFWVLSLIGSFRQKFRDVHSNKELLGTKKDPGIIQRYVEKAMLPDATPERDFFKELFFHQSFCALADRITSLSIMQVPPISNICAYFESMWPSLASNDQFRGQRTSTLQSIGSRRTHHLIVPSEKLGIILLGNLQVSQTSGQLQLSDATGMVDVKIPDLLSTEHLYRTYKVSRFTVAVQWVGETPPVQQDAGVCPVSWHSLLKEGKAKPRAFTSLKYCVNFYMRDATHVHELDRRQTADSHSISRSSAWQYVKEVHGRWDKTKRHLDSLKVELQSQVAKAITGVRSCGPKSEILSYYIGTPVHRDHHFEVNCKVEAVRLLLFESYRVPATFETAVDRRLLSNDGNSSTSVLKSSSLGIPLTLACFVVDDGSGPADCWALGDAAVSLLGLTKMAAGQPKLPRKLIERVFRNYSNPFPDSQSLTELLPIEMALSTLVQRYGWVLVQNESAGDGSERSHSHIFGEGGQPLSNDEQALLQMLVSTACNSRPLIVSGSTIPSLHQMCRDACKGVTGPCEVNICRKEFPADPSLDQSRAHFFALGMSPVPCVTYAKAISEQVARLLQLENMG